MQELQARLVAINKMKRYGDAKVIAEMTGYSRVYVAQVLDTENTRHNEDIVDAAERYMDFRRKQMQARFNELIGNISE